MYCRFYHVVKKCLFGSLKPPLIAYVCFLLIKTFEVIVKSFVDFLVTNNILLFPLSDALQTCSK